MFLIKSRKEHKVVYSLTDKDIEKANCGIVALYDFTDHNDIKRYYNGKWSHYNLNIPESLQAVRDKQSNSRFKIRNIIDKFSGYIHGR